MDSLCGRLAPRVLFSQRPRLHFCPPAGVCECGGATRVSKTRTKSVATLVIGQFEAIETQRHCPCCGAHDRCDELRSLTPHRGRFGFDVIEWVGRALFVEGRNERAVQAELAARNIPISTSEVGFLGKRFIVYLALAHRACQDALREHLCAKGGYILHLDATCEGDSPQLFSAMDELSRMVLGNRKMPSEDSRHMIPLLEELKAAYGVPLALVHDMGSAILKAAATVFPTVPSFVCHFHFLRDLGKDLFGNDYSIPHHYVGRTLVVSATLDTVRILDAATVLATHRRSFDRGCQIEDPAHIEELERHKRLAREHRATDRLHHAAPSSKALFVAAAERNHHLGVLARGLIALLNAHGPAALERAIAAALASDAAHLGGVRHFIDQYRKDSDKPPPLALDLPDDPRLRTLSVRPHDLADYDRLRDESDSGDTDAHGDDDDEQDTNE